MIPDTRDIRARDVPVPMPGYARSARSGPSSKPLLLTTTKFQNNTGFFFIFKTGFLTGVDRAGADSMID